jgi:hypothetical protein
MDRTEFAVALLGVIFRYARVREKHETTFKTRRK